MNLVTGRKESLFFNKDKLSYPHFYPIFQFSVPSTFCCSCHHNSSWRDPSHSWLVSSRLTSVCRPLLSKAAGPKEHSTACRDWPVQRSWGWIIHVVWIVPFLSFKIKFFSPILHLFWFFNLPWNLNHLNLSRSST